MDRRTLLHTAGLATLAALSTRSLAAEHDHHHHHAGHAGGGPRQALLTAAADCVRKGQVYLAHGLVLLGEGDTGIAGCAKSVNQMLALCGALASLGAQESHLVPALAKIALDACQQCKKHADKHPQCKACAESCGECIKQRKAVLA